MDTARSVPLPSGEKIAALGQGTWHFAEDPARWAEEVASIRLGVDLGMTVIDTAETSEQMALSQNFERTWSGRRLERSVEGMEVVVGQRDVSGGGVLPNVGRCSGAWDSVDAVVLKHPG